MKSSGWGILLAVPSVVLMGMGCGGKQGLSFQEEFRLSVAAGRSQLSDKDRTLIEQQLSGLSFQMTDPATFSLIQGFAALPERAHEALRAQGYLKWAYANLPDSQRPVFDNWVATTIAQIQKQGGTVNPHQVRANLTRAQVGYLVTDIPQQDKVVNIFISWDQGDPTWVTVVNAKLAGTQTYFKASLEALRALQDKTPGAVY